MSGGHAGGDFPRAKERFGDRQRSARQASGERLAVDQLEDEIVDPSVEPDVMNRANVGMIECSDRARFGVEPLASSRIG